jgi:hypothetical protein
MSTPPPPEGVVRSAEAVNADIRALLERTRRRLSDAERERFEELQAEWVRASRREMTTAA